MNLPGFSADASIYPASRHYQTKATSAMPTTQILQHLELAALRCPPPGLCAKACGLCDDPELGGGWCGICERCFDCMGDL